MMTIYQYLPFQLKLNAPAILSLYGGDPNSSRTLPYIPGTAIRGAMAKVLGDPQADESKLREFRDLVLGGKVRYLHAYPLHEKTRALPTPVSLRQNKYECNSKREQLVEAVDLSAFEGILPCEFDDDIHWPKESLKTVHEPFLTIGSARSTLVQPKKSARIHHQRDRKMGRAWKDERGQPHGAIFAFESLDSGQSFAGMFQIRGDTTDECNRIASRIREAIGDTIQIGRSRRGGYGGMAAIEHWGDIRGREIEGYGKDGFKVVTTGNLGTVFEQGTTFRLMLTSACIIRCPNTGQIDPTALDLAIENALGNKVDILRKRWAFEIIGGFNRKWRLETPQVMAVAAGSIYVLKAKHSISIDELQRIEDEGIGERKEEGYGRLLFMDAPLQSVFLEREEPPRLKSPGGNPPPLVIAIEKRIIDARIKRRIVERAAEIAGLAKSLPSNSLIGRLRNALRGNPNEAICTLKVWLGGIGEKCLKVTAMKQLEECRIAIDGSSKRFNRWLLDAVESENVLDWLNAEKIAQQSYVVSVETSMNYIESKASIISVRLIDAILSYIALNKKSGFDVGKEDRNDS